MGKKISIYLLSCILMVILIYPSSAQGQLPVVSNKGSTVTVPKVTGMLQKDAEEAIAKAGLEVANIIERETPFPAGKVVRQKPIPDTKVEMGSGVVLVVSKSKEQIQLKTPVEPSGTTQPAEPAEKLTKSTSTTSGDVQLKNEWFGGQARSAAANLRAAGLTVKPNMIASDKRRGTVMGMTMPDRRLTPGNLLARGSTVTLEISGGLDYKPLPGDKELVNSPIPEKQILPKNSTINTAALKMTGMRIVPQTISTGPLVMTGMRTASQTIVTAPLQMTGMLAASQTIVTAPLQMTGMRATSQTITTSPLQMTGMRVNSITIKTAPLKMMGMRP